MALSTRLATALAATNARNRIEREARDRAALPEYI